MHILSSYKIIFSRITTVKRNRFGRNFARRRRVTYVARCPANFSRHPPKGRKMPPKDFAKFFLSPKQHIVSPSFRSTISVKFEHKTWINVVMKTFGTEFRNFSNRSYFPRKALFVGVFGGAATLAFGPTVNLSITFEGPGMFAFAVTFSYDLLFSRYRGCKVTPNFRNFATCRHFSVAATASTC